MSKQWGNGFHEGVSSGFSIGFDSGQSIGQMSVGEISWHVVNCAIDALERGDDLKAVMLLRTLLFALAEATGHTKPKFNRMTEKADV